MEILTIIAVGSMCILLGRFMLTQHKKTRKEAQEIKTRLTKMSSDMESGIEKSDRHFRDLDHELLNGSNPG